MKTAKQYKSEMQQALGNFLRGDPVLTNGKTLLESFAETITADALTKAAGLCRTKAAQVERIEVIHCAEAIEHFRDSLNK